MTETVLTSRRALLLGEGPAVAGRLRVSDRSVRFTPLVAAEPVEAALADVRRVALGRRGTALVVVTDAGALRLRCFGARAVALLVVATLREA